MRRKIVRSKAAPVNKSVKQLAKTLTIYMAVVLSVSVVVFSIMTSVKMVNDYKAVWDSQNDCIAYMVRLGIERKDILRSGNGCVIQGEK